MRTITVSAACLGLRNLRKILEAEAEALSEEQALILTDVCAALRLEEAEANYIIGQAYTSFVTARIPYVVNGNGSEPAA